MVWARSEAETAPDPVNSAMKLVRPDDAFRYMSSADFWPNFPANISALPNPGKAMELDSRFAVSTADMDENVLRQKGTTCIIPDCTIAVNPKSTGAGHLICFLSAGKSGRGKKIRTTGFHVPYGTP